MKWWGIYRGGGLVLGLGGIYSLKSSVFGISGDCSPHKKKIKIANTKTSSIALNTIKI